MDSGCFSISLIFFIIIERQLTCGHGAIWNPKNIIEQIPCFTPTTIIPPDWIKTTKLKEVTYFPFEAKSSSYLFSKELINGGIKNDKQYEKYCLYSVKEVVNNFKDSIPKFNVTYLAFGKSVSNTFKLKIVQKGKNRLVEHWNGKSKEETLYPIWKSSSKSNPIYLIVSCLRKPGIMTWFTTSQQPTILIKVKDKILKIVAKLGFDPELATETYLKSKCNLS